MATIALNKFRRIGTILTTTPQMIYKVPFDKATIILTALGTNTTPNIQTVSISVSTINPLNGAPYIDLVKNIEIGAYDAAHLTIGKVVITDGDSLLAQCSNLSAISLNLSILESVNT